MRIDSLLLLFWGMSLSAHAQTEWKHLPSDATSAALSTNGAAPTGIQGAGVLRVKSAILGNTGMVRVSLTGDYFRQNNFPVLNVQNTRTHGILGVSYVALPGLETYFSYQAAVNNNSRTTPNQIQSLGDVSLGLKWTPEWVEGIHAGLDIEGLYLAGPGSSSKAAFGVFPRAVFSWDRTQAYFPFRLHANAGWSYDTTSSWRANKTLNASQEFALGISSYSRLVMSAAFEIPLPHVTPFLEYGVSVPLGVAEGKLTGPDGLPVALGRAMPQTLTVGSKWTTIRPFSVVAALDVGLAQRVGLGVPATPPWTFVLGAAMSLDTSASRPQQAQEAPPSPVPAVAVDTQNEPTALPLSGFVIDSKSRTPISGASIVVEGQNFPPITSDAVGRFVTPPIPFGTIKVSTQKEGYSIQRQWFSFSPTKRGPLQVVLEEAARLSTVTITVTSQRKPIAAKVTIFGKEPVSLNVPSRTNGARILLAPGKFVVEVFAEGHLAQTREFQTLENASDAISFDLIPFTEKRAVALADKRIELLKPLQFVGNSATLAPESKWLLQQVVDLLVRNKLKKLRVESHTDNQGPKAKNMTLSKDRAQAVVQFLVEQGVNRSRLEARGFGDEKPIAPNATSRGRELNRRVELYVVP